MPIEKRSDNERHAFMRDVDRAPAKRERQSIDAMTPTLVIVAVLALLTILAVM